MTQQMTDWKVEDWIRDYGYMKREIDRLNKILNQVRTAPVKLTATYGIEATLPKGSSGKSQEELKELSREERKLYQFIEITNYLWACKDLIEDDKEWTVYDCMLREVPYKEIAKHLNCSRETIRTMKNNIVGIIGMKVTQDKFLHQLKNIAKAG